MCACVCVWRSANAVEDLVVYGRGHGEEQQDEEQRPQQAGQQQHTLQPVAPPGQEAQHVQRAQHPRHTGVGTAAGEGRHGREKGGMEGNRKVGRGREGRREGEGSTQT